MCPVNSVTHCRSKKVAAGKAAGRVPRRASGSNDKPNLTRGFRATDSPRHLESGHSFFPASGYRNNNSAVPYNVGSNAYYWTAGPNNTNNGRNLNFNPGNVNPLNNNNRSNGFGVRAAQELTNLCRKRAVVGD